VFEDLQCPDCRKEHPHLIEAAASNDVPLVIHDFPIQRHKWAFPAAVLARYFDAIAPALGAQFRSYVFQNQPGIGVDNLQRLAEQFAAAHGLTPPAASIRTAGSPRWSRPTTTSGCASGSNTSR